MIFKNNIECNIRRKASQTALNVVLTEVVPHPLTTTLVPAATDELCKSMG
jgi:hypothetical protein